MTTTNIDEILSRPYVRRLEPSEDGGFVASILEFPGCIAEGDTAGEAMTKLDEAARSWVEVALAHGQSIREPVSLDGYSGKTALRMPRSLHRQVAELSELEGTSLNQLLVSAISHYVGGQSAVRFWKKHLSPSIQLNAPVFNTVVSLNIPTYVSDAGVYGVASEVVENPLVEPLLQYEKPTIVTPVTKPLEVPYA